MDDDTSKQKTLEIPYLSDDDVKKLIYVNNLLLQELLSIAKEEKKNGFISDQMEKS